MATKIMELSRTELADLMCGLEELLDKTNNLDRMGRLEELMDKLQKADNCLARLDE